MGGGVDPPIKKPSQGSLLPRSGAGKSHRMGRACSQQRSGQGLPWSWLSQPFICFLPNTAPGSVTTGLDGALGAGPEPLSLSHGPCVVSVLLI